MRRIISNDFPDNAEVQVTGFRSGTQDTKDFGRVVLGGGYAGVTAPAHLPIVAASN